MKRARNEKNLARKKVVLPDGDFNPLEDAEALPPTVPSSPVQSGGDEKVQSEEVHLEPELNPEYETLGDLYEQGDHSEFSDQLSKIQKTVESLKDSKQRAVYNSLNRVWSSLGSLQNQMAMFKGSSAEYKLDKAYGQSNKLYR